MTPADILASSVGWLLEGQATKVLWKIHASFPSLGFDESGFAACPRRRRGVLWQPPGIPLRGVPLHTGPSGSFHGSVQLRLEERALAPPALD
jgi:hypothetical protein